MTDETERDLYVHPGKRVTKSGHDNGFGQGMALRDYFAAQFIQTLEVSSGRMFLHSDGSATYDPDAVAAGLYRLADAMIEQRNK
jgi:hypothetical protein